MWITWLNFGAEFSSDWHSFQTESTRSVKYERVYLKAYDSVSAARTDIAQYFDWYNTDRAHSSIGDMTPFEAYELYLPKESMVA
jgi:putative transposase